MWRDINAEHNDAQSLKTITINHKPSSGLFADLGRLNETSSWRADVDEAADRCNV